jgi:hypothetical protein
MTEVDQGIPEVGSLAYLLQYVQENRVGLIILERGMKLQTDADLDTTIETVQDRLVDETTRGEPA